MTGFRMWLGVIFATLLVYTGVVIANHGWDLFSIFFGDMAKMEWPGQFNLDFTFMLTLSGLWVAWRNAFSTLGIALGLFALFGGALFLSVYLLFLTVQTNGDMRALLLGPARS